MMPRGRSHRTVPGDGLGILARSAGTGRNESHVYSLEIVVVLQQFHLKFLAPEGILRTRTARRAEQYQLVHGEIPFIEHPQKFLSYGPACSNNSCFHCSFVFFWFVFVVCNCPFGSFGRKITTIGRSFPYFKRLFSESPPGCFETIPEPAKRTGYPRPPHPNSLATPLFPAHPRPSAGAQQKLKNNAPFVLFFRWYLLLLHKFLNL